MYDKEAVISQKIYQDFQPGGTGFFIVGRDDRQGRGDNGCFQRQEKEGET